MFPYIQLGGRPITWYMLTALTGVLTVIFFTYKFSKKQKLDEFHMLFMMLFAFGGVLVFSHILYAITVPDITFYVFTHLGDMKSFDDFLLGMQLVFGGSVFYGGLIGAIFVFFIYTKAKKLSFGDYSDIGALAIPLFHFFGRIGCFLEGCCYGVEWEHGVVYNYSVVSSANHVHRFPVQLVEAVLNLMLFFLLLYLYNKGKAKHKVLVLYLLIYPTYRFILEFFRGDEYRGHVGVLSTSQFISVILFA
ncbi:MAG: prolipoprotein diacylglyceryl transferase, partial [Ruminococcus sp.]|nr:prolipoprotein diacylglyceryl transferase [Ruminococcus sp.]